MEQLPWFCKRVMILQISLITIKKKIEKDSLHQKKVLSLLFQSSSVSLFLSLSLLSPPLLVGDISNFELIISLPSLILSFIPSAPSICTIFQQI